MRTFNPARHAAALALAGALLLAADAAGAQRQPPPAPLPARPLQFPAFRETTLPNGLRLIVVENHAHPVASVTLLVGSGASSVPPERLGLAGVMAELLPKGTTTRTGAQVSGAIEATGGSIGAGAAEDYSNVYATVLSEHLPLAMETVADVAMNPSFPETEVTAALSRATAQLQQWMADPTYVAERRFGERLYGSHPYGRYRSPQTLATLDRQAFVDFHRAHFHAGNALLVVAGDVDPARVEALARERFGGWRGARRCPSATPAFPPSRRRASCSSTGPGSVQSSVRAGSRTTRASDADYPSLLVMNKILGGGTDSRLFDILREQRGWTYGAYSDANRPRDVGRLIASMEVRSEVTDSAVAELLAQVRRMAAEPVSAAELEAAKGYLVGSFPIGIQTAEQVAGQVAITRLLGLPMEDLLQRRERIAAVTVDDVRRAAARHLRPDSLTVVVVGDAGRVLAGLERIAPVELVDVEGRPMDRAALEVRASGESFDIARLRPAVLEYRFLAQGNPVGRSTATLSQDGAGWKSVTELPSAPCSRPSRPAGARRGSRIDYVEIVRGRLRGPRGGAGGERPLRGHRDHAGAGGRQQDVRCGGGARRRVEHDGRGDAFHGRPGGGQDDRHPRLQHQHGRRGPGHVPVGATESVTVPAGTFQAFRVSSTGGSSPVTLWLRADGAARRAPPGDRRPADRRRADGDPVGPHPGS